MNALFTALFLSLYSLTAFNVESNPDDISILAACHAYVNVSLDHTGHATITPDDIDAGSYSTLGPVTLSISHSNFNCSYLGDTLVVILTVTDINGDSNQCYSEVIVEDNDAQYFTSAQQQLIDGHSSKVVNFNANNLANIRNQLSWKLDVLSNNTVNNGIISALPRKSTVNAAAPYVIHLINLELPFGITLGFF